MRIGIGYDVHRLTEGRPLIIGGVEIPYEKGLLGHSDADVLVHAVMDALLGAAGRGDIGCYFPDNDMKYKGISSLVLLERVGDIIRKAGLEVENIDAVVIAQRPKLMPHSSKMKAKMAEALGVVPGRINIKASTTEGLGFEGRGEGIAAQAVALLKES